MPEPLCAIWEPSSEALIAGFLERDLRCPRKMLVEADTELLAQPNPRALVNVNTPADLGAANDLMGLCHPGAKPVAKAIHVRFFAVFREQAGCSAETVTTQARTVGELFSDACERHGLADGLPGAKVAVNDELVSWSAALSDGGTVLFFPPVAGG